MKLAFVSNSSSSSGATILNTITSLGVFTGTIGISSGSAVTLAEIQAFGLPSDTLVFLHALDFTTNLLNVVNQLLDLGYVVLANISASMTPAKNVLYGLGAFSSVGIESNISASGFVSYTNLLLVNSNALLAGTTVSIRSTSASAIVGQQNPASAAAGYIDLGYTTSGYSSFGLWQKGSTIAKNGCLVHAGALFFNSNVPGASGLSSLFLDLIALITSKGFIGRYKIAGTVSDSTNQPLQRLLRAFDKTSGGLIGETTSASDGSYKISANSADPVTVVCYHDASDTNNSQVKDDIVPILDE